MPVAISECSQRCRIFVETDLVVSISEVNFWEILCSRQLVKDVVYARERVAVLHCESVKSAVIYAEAQISIICSDEKDSCSPRAGTWSNKSLIHPITVN